MNNLLLKLRKLYAGTVKLVSYLQSPFLLFVRLYWGLQLVQNGWGKLHNLARVTEFFASLNLPTPGPTAAFVSTFECVAGIFLILGLASRLIGLMLLVDMTVAYITAEPQAFFSFFRDPGKFYTADAYTFWFAALILLIFGPGLFALDTLLDRYFVKRGA
jgi:putative oxidoreductase